MKLKAHILIVDDVADNIQVAMNVLREDGYTFSFATAGKEALAILERESSHIDLILLDIMMPVIDGFDVCKKIKLNPLTQHIPVIFLTAKVDVDSIKKGFDLGAIDYISKPFQAEELLARVKTHIQLYQSKQLLHKNNLALESKIKYGHERLFSELEDNQKEMIYILTELMEFSSDETGQHVRRISEISSLLAHYHPSLNQDDEDVLYHASPMHDLGKMTIRQDVLHKPGLYTEAEFDEMKVHTSNAYNLLRHSQRRFMKAAAVIAHEHHEHWDGNGYPRKLKGEAIHIYGRIVALADVFDALYHKRCYKDAWEMNDVIDYIASNKGKQFDPELVDIFMDKLDEFKHIVMPD